MTSNEYDEGDYIQIRDVQRARARIGMQPDIELGMVVKIVHIRGTYLVCEHALPTGQVEVKPFPPGHGDPVTFTPGDEMPDWPPQRRAVTDAEADVVDDIREFLE